MVCIRRLTRGSLGVLGGFCWIYRNSLFVILIRSLKQGVLFMRLQRIGCSKRGSNNHFPQHCHYQLPSLHYCTCFLSLGDIVCEMTVVRITSKDIVFWFRSHTDAEIRSFGSCGERRFCKGI
ncbi:hypothetical protein KIW84_061929 [Lathyrus oleraceus]|uniref:Uncharacterized protein n=1 Tax=Pisum sativum TaxID=3888 RepID=A0A9D4W5K1_PEA|nr:hypothetical protein KIW84_061929 [Pisum sativum]